MIYIMPNPEKALHDKNVQGLRPETLLAAMRDLGSQSLHNRKDPETRWKLERRAAIQREIIRRRIL